MLFWLKMCVLAIVVLSGQYLSKTLILSESLDKHDFFSHGIVFLLTGLGYSVFLLIKNKYPSYSGLIFGAISFVKSILLIILILPFLSDKTTSDLVFVVQFLLIYAMYLFFEIFMLLKFLKS